MDKMDMKELLYLFQMGIHLIEDPTDCFKFYNPINVRDTTTVFVLSISIFISEDLNAIVN